MESNLAEYILGIILLFLGVFCVIEFIFRMNKKRFYEQEKFYMGWFGPFVFLPKPYNFYFAKAVWTIISLFVMYATLDVSMWWLFHIDIYEYIDYISSLFN